MRNRESINEHKSLGLCEWPSFGFRDCLFELNTTKPNYVCILVITTPSPSSLPLFLYPSLFVGFAAFSDSVYEFFIIPNQSSFYRSVLLLHNNYASTSFFFAWLCFQFQIRLLIWAFIYQLLCFMLNFVKSMVENFSESGSVFLICNWVGSLNKRLWLPLL